MTPRSYIGVSPLRSEDDGLVRGAHPYVADLRIPGCLEACFVRSFEAHGELQEVDVSGSLRLKGVVAAFSAAELPDLPPVPTREPAPAEMQRPSLARDRVRFAGEPVAVVIARDRYTAEDGAERVIQTFDSLDAVIGVDAALSSTAPSLFEGSDNVVSTRDYGASVEDVMANAAVVVEGRFYNQRLAPTSIEPRAVLAQWDRDRLTVWASHQAPHRLRGELAAAFGLGLDEVRVRVPKVGGAFGAKSQTFAEYIVVANVARKLDRPVRWIEDRREALQSATHGRGQSQTLRLAADDRGMLLALEAFIDADVGAYPDTGALVPAMTAWVLSGPYRIERLYARIRCVVTNAAPTASYRGAGRPEAAFALERLVDKLARKLHSIPSSCARQTSSLPPIFPTGLPREPSTTRATMPLHCVRRSSSQATKGLGRSSAGDARRATAPFSESASPAIWSDQGVAPARASTGRSKSWPMASSSRDRAQLPKGRDMKPPLLRSSPRRSTSS